MARGLGVPGKFASRGESNAPRCRTELRLLMLVVDLLFWSLEGRDAVPKLREVVLVGRGRGVALDNVADLEESMLADALDDLV